MNLTQDRHRSITSNMTIHALKTISELYQVTGILKTFEVRWDDRGFKVGDTLWLQEWSEDKGYTGASKKYEVSYILRGPEFGISEGYCVMGLKPDVRIREWKERGIMQQEEDVSHRGPVINGLITVEAGQPNVNYIGLAGLGFEKIAADEWQIVVRYNEWADYRRLLESMIALGAVSYTYTPAKGVF